MYKAWCLFFLVCCYHVTKGNPDSAVKISTDSRRLYHELNLKDVVGERDGIIPSAVPSVGNV